jgi:hypothetical protein
MNTGVYTRGTCWNYWKCSEGKRNKCSVFTSSSNDECFILSNFSAEGCAVAEDCYNCPWYKYCREE